MEKPKIALMLAPALAVIGLLFLGGLIFGVLQSINVLSFTGNSGINLEAYKSIFSSRSFWVSLGFTLWIACAATSISSILGLLCALVLRGSVRFKNWLMFVFQLSLPIPHAVGAIMVLLLFSQSGWFSRLTVTLSLTNSPSDFPILVQDPLALGVILEYVWKETPFIGVNILAALAGLDSGFEQVAASLGAGRWQRLRHVILPAVMPSLLRSSLIVFTFSFSTFEVPYLLAPTTPSTLSVLAYHAYTDSDLNSRPRAIALGLVMALLTGILMLIYIRFSRRFIRS